MYRQNVQYPSEVFVKALEDRRRSHGMNRLTLSSVEKADQEDLPPVVPPRLDAQQVVALKLMKRYINLCYSDRALRRPPSIYFTKLSQTCGFEPAGLTAQLERFARKVKAEMELSLRTGSGPDERNPSYTPDRLNDRWPTSQGERKTLAEDMDVLLDGLARARVAEFKDLGRILAGLFGEQVSKRTIESFMQRADQRGEKKSFKYEQETGAVITSAALAAPAVARAAVPQHNFHCEIASRPPHGSLGGSPCYVGSPCLSTWPRR